MAEYVTTFTKPYPSGYQDLPSEATPVGHEIIESWETAIVALESYLSENNIPEVSASIPQSQQTGVYIASITINGTQYKIYTPMVRYQSSITGGTKVGTLTFGSYSFDVYAPTASTGGSTVSVVPKTLTGTNIAEITVDGTTYQLYAPTGGGGSGSTVTAEATLTEGTQIGKITIDGVETILYAPTASTITVDAELSATSENAIQNKVVDAAVKKLQQQIDAGGTGGSVTVDSALSTTSENPVQNKVVTAELNKKIETLDDESQAPDVVNFDLDSELSLTSVKGVQNKAIAEEFQKYANGTKVVAKAAEANTASTASNAEKVNGHTVGTDVPSNAVFTDTIYDDSAVKTSIQNIVNGTTQVGSATKATQDAQGNVINETYAKKTEVPQGTVVDDALSSTSTNPVQNKVVKAEFDKVNSNLPQKIQMKGAEWTGTLESLDNNVCVCINGGNATDKPSGASVYGYYMSTYLNGGAKYCEYLDFANKKMYSKMWIGSVNNGTGWIELTADTSKLNSDIAGIKDGTTPAAKAVADEDGNNIKSTYAKKTETLETVTEDVNVVLNSDLFDSTYSNITCIRIGKLCVLSFTIYAPKAISSTLDEIVLMTIVGTKYRPKKPDVNSPRQTFQGFAVGNYDENGKKSQSLNNTVRIITSSANNYTEIITRDKDRLNWSGYVQGQIMWVTD